jgi:hypothetical protein
MSDESTQAKPAWAPGEPVVAGPGQYYRNTRYLMMAILIGMGLWFGYDGWVTWPQANDLFKQLERDIVSARRSGDRVTEQKLIQQQRTIKPRSDADIRLQKILCLALPPLGIVVLIWALRNSRGEYRLEGNTLHVPGHPPVPFENITEMDRHLWDRKGIAFVSYDLGNGQQGRIRLDDFVYDRDPTDEIFKRVEQYISPPEAQEQKSERPAQN